MRHGPAPLAPFPPPPPRPPPPRPSPLPRAPRPLPLRGSAPPRGSFPLPSFLSDLTRSRGGGKPRPAAGPDEHRPGLMGHGHAPLDQLLSAAPRLRVSRSSPLRGSVPPR